MQKTPDIDTLSVEEAWQPLPTKGISAEIAAHLLRRIGFSAKPEAIKAVQSEGLAKTLERAFQPSTGFQMPAELTEFSETYIQRTKEIQKNTKDPEERMRLQRKLRMEDNALFNDFALQWFRHAAQPEHSALEKFTLFLQDVFVVERPVVRETTNLFGFQETLRSGIQKDYPTLCKAVSREPAMIRYLDLNKNTAKKPNENFARELFELFTLGEGNYTEADIKEAARAFTGYRIKSRYDFQRDARQKDKSDKTVFGQTGPWDGDDIIDLTFQQPAARTFFINEFLKFYLSDTPVHPKYVEALGGQWAENHFEIKFLINTIFQSRLFHQPIYRGNRIKSPTHFYIGLCQDLQLDIVPFNSRLIQSMRAMGQSFFDPPNVRGWLYGKNWINSTTITARRQVVDYLFTKLNEDKLNGNDQRTLEAARAADQANFLVSQATLERIGNLPTQQLVNYLKTYFITEPSRPTYSALITELLSQPEDVPITRLRNTLIALLKSPAYSLC